MDLLYQRDSSRVKPCFLLECQREKESLLYRLEMLCQPEKMSYQMVFPDFLGMRRALLLNQLEAEQ
jgi:hypothetical protein